MKRTLIHTKNCRESADCTNLFLRQDDQYNPHNHNIILYKCERPPVAITIEAGDNEYDPDDEPGDDPDGEPGGEPDGEVVGSGSAQGFVIDQVPFSHFEVHRLSFRESTNWQYEAPSPLTNLPASQPYPLAVTPEDI